jgi:hypothetical protein
MSSWGDSIKNAIIYLLPMAIIAGTFLMISWERVSRTQIKVINVRSAGGSTTHYVPKDGNTVTVDNKELGVSRTWPINELATIPTQYPDMFALPRFMTHDIQTVIVVEGDWEPLLNRSPHRKQIMSPDAVNFLRAIANKYGEQDTGNKSDAGDAIMLRDQIDQYLAGVSTGPTREMIAQPDVIGALKKSAALKALASVSDDLLNALNQIRNQLARFAGLNAMLLYVLLAFSILLSGASLFVGIKTLTEKPTASSVPADVGSRLDAIQRALGIPIAPVTGGK